MIQTNQIALKQLIDIIIISFCIFEQKNSENLIFCVKKINLNLRKLI